MKMIKDRRPRFPEGAVHPNTSEDHSPSWVPPGSLAQGYHLLRRHGRRAVPPCLLQVPGLGTTEPSGYNQRRLGTTRPSGPRADRSFVAVNCAALPEHLLESELFGHARGAFTGASNNRRGMFVEAQDGTIFLDEIGDLPLSLQGKLLRVLQSGEIRPVGAEATRTVNVRCIAATHKDLAVLVEKGQFREDLFFRLDVLRVRVPPLRERGEDTPRLVDHFLRQSLERSSRSVLAGFEPDALDFLASCDWPGNVRQLENLIERLVVTASQPHARLEDVKRALGPASTSDPIVRLLQNPMTLQDLEDRYLAGILKLVGGNKLKAAEILGVDPSTIYRREKRS
jgi:two-component system, NtrC family, response regulator HydG